MGSMTLLMMFLPTSRIPVSTVASVLGMKLRIIKNLVSMSMEPCLTDVIPFQECSFAVPQTNV